jgi:hypothetical protein
MPLNFDSDVDFVDQDVRYMDILYAETPTGLDRWRNWFQSNLPAILAEIPAPEGKVVQAGTWNGDFYNVLINLYGADNCVGFDIAQYIEDDSITYGDFRIVGPQTSIQSAVFYNGMGSWKNNATSKQAGLNWATENLVSGGIYFDVHHGKHDREQILKELPDFTWYNTFGQQLVVLIKN